MILCSNRKYCFVRSLLIVLIRERLGRIRFDRYGFSKFDVKHNRGQHGTNGRSYGTIPFRKLLNGRPDFRGEIAPVRRLRTASGGPYRVVRGDKVSGWRRDRVERVLAFDGRHAETVHGHAVRLVSHHQPVLLVRAHLLGHRGFTQPVTAAHGAQDLLTERVVPEHVHQRVERGRGQRARVHHLVRQLHNGHVHEQRRPAEQVSRQHHHGRLHGAALLPEQQCGEQRVGVAPRQVGFHAHAVLARAQAVPVIKKTNRSTNVCSGHREP